MKRILMAMSLCALMLHTSCESKKEEKEEVSAGLKESVSRVVINVRRSRADSARVRDNDKTSNTYILECSHLYNASHETAVDCMVMVWLSRAVKDMSALHHRNTIG